MAHDLSQHHLDLCQKLERQLQRIRAELQSPHHERKTVPIDRDQGNHCPIDLSRFLDELDRYMGWVEANREEIAAALAVKTRAGGGSDAA